MSDLLVQRADGIVTATLNRPKRKNAITYALFDDLGIFFREAMANSADRCVVLRGTGGDFSTGLDLSDPERKTSSVPARERMDRINETAMALHQLTKPTIAVVDGMAAGAGMSLALGCDFVIASTRARFCAVFVRRGLSLDVGMSWYLPRLIGLARAKELALLGETTTAQQAYEMGLIYRVVEPNNLDDEVNSLAQRLAGGPTLALGSDINMLNSSMSRNFREALDAEADEQTMNIQSADVAEAIAAFLEKRESKFLGR